MASSLAPGARLLDRTMALRERFDQVDISALLVTHPANVFYLSNFRGSAGMLLVTRDGVTLVVDARYATAAAALLDGPAAGAALDLALVESSYEQTVVAVVERLGSARTLSHLGIESAHMTVAQHDWLVQALAGTGAAVRPTTGFVEAGRAVKDPHELAILRDAGQRISSVMTEALRGLRPGQSEREVAADIDRAIARVGFERPAFDTIVAAGANTALPHARPSTRVLASGDLVLLDFGGRLEGYCVDMTRVASLGPPSDEVNAWHAAVCEAHAAALSVVREGVAAVEVDAAARRALERCGLADAFTHGTGHGLGIEVHEAPRIGKRRSSADVEADVPFRAGMVCTVEPGVYLPTRGGIRLEDDLVVTESGYELLTSVPLDLQVL
jgi:Xaa-Pro aminopeptidase